MTKYGNIVIFSIPWSLLFRKKWFPFWKGNIECLIIFPDVSESKNGWHIQIMITLMSGIVFGCSYQLKCCYTQDKITTNVGFSPVSKTKKSTGVDTQ